MEYQIRNWYYFTWLSGDFICEQHVHSLDKVLWAMKDEAPAVCTASGGRSQRTGEMYGNIYDHFNSVFEWKNGVKAFSSCRQWRGCDGNVSDYAFGTKGTAAIQRARISGENEWRWRGQAPGMYDAEHVALFSAIRTNQPINNGDYMCKATLMGIMARTAAYTGKKITWEQLMNSTLDLSPPAYEWGPLEMRPVPVPGTTKFV
jgi:predicted dehydrogenase